VWTSDGRIVYSDEPRLIGRRYPLGEDEREALVDGRAAVFYDGIDTGGDLVALTGFAFFVFGHSHPLEFATEPKHCRRIILSRIDTSIDAPEWGVNGEEALQDCDMRGSEKIAEGIALALDKSVSNLVACARCCQAKRIGSCD